MPMSVVGLGWGGGKALDLLLLKLYQVWVAGLVARKQSRHLVGPPILVLMAVFRAEMGWHHLRE